jgi:preprotein translocase subunit SecE
MARKRQRARDRKQNKLHRENIPGSLDHASGEVEEVEAAIVAGAGGEPVELEPEPEPDVVASVEPFESDSDEPVEPDEEPLDDEQLGAGAGEVATRPHKAPGFRVFTFFRACWAELQRVDWPDRRQVGQATAVVLGFVVVAGAYLGAADVVARKIVDFILQ